MTAASIAVRTKGAEIRFVFSETRPLVPEFRMGSMAQGVLADPAVHSYVAGVSEPPCAGFAPGRRLSNGLPSNVRPKNIEHRQVEKDKRYQRERHSSGADPL